ncbi:MAG: tetratricopeptide repeat protein, partial [Thaumarchaeota archaeon]|nr:tetratricopeptide repeat protein [Nitrososphaerota archaeon]
MKILLCSIILLFSTPVIFAYGQLESDVDFMVYKGGQYLKMFNYEEAITFFDKALELEPNNVEALYQKANTLSALEKYNEAIEHYEKVLNIEPDKQISKLKLEHALLQTTSYRVGFLDGTLEISVKNS